MFRLMMAFMFVAIFSGAALAEAEHPRLLITKKEIPALREKVKKEPFATMLRSLEAGVDADNWGVGTASRGYDTLIAAHRHAWLYVIKNDDSHAKKARAAVEQSITEREWANPRQKGLTLYVEGLYVSMIYDLCYGAPSWDAAFSEKVSKEIKRQADVIFKSGGSEQNGSPASNWQALRWSNAATCYMATDEAINEKDIEACYGRVVRYLRENLGSDSSKGWNIEGLGYMYYPMGNGVCPFAIAYSRRTGKDIRKDAPQIQYTLWTGYAAMVPTPMGLLRPDFGDDNPGTNAEGTMGFAFHFSDPALVPGLKYWYDRTVGIKGEKTFDRSRFGTIASILYYPADVAEKNPLDIPAWRDAFIDLGGTGYFTYRNQYKDNTDIVGQLYVKLMGNKGHNGPDALSFRIVGLDTIWATGGGRYGPKLNGQDAFVRSMNTLYPSDPDGRVAISDQSGKVVGKPVINGDGSGSMTANIKQNNVGTKNHTRRFAASFDKALGASAAFVISDTSDDGQVWQMVTLAPNKIATGGNTFTITNPQGHTLRGTVLYPAKTEFKTGTRIRGSNAGDIKENNFVHFGSSDGDYLVVLTIAPKGASHPKVAATGNLGGDAPAGTVTVGGVTFTISGDAISSK